MFDNGYVSRKYLILCLGWIIALPLTAQVTASLPGTDLCFYKETTQERRDRLFQNITQFGIQKKLQQPLRGDTELSYQEAFWSIALTGYHPPEIEEKISAAVEVCQTRSPAFQQALLELLHSRFPEKYREKITQLARSTNNVRVLTMALTYISADSTWIPMLQSWKQDSSLPFFAKDRILLNWLEQRLRGAHRPKANLEPLRKPSWISAGQVWVISFQRRNRNYPGLVMVMDTARRWMRETDGRLFAVPQFARSATNMPGTLTNGNTPQGLYRLFGFGTSRSNFIGPTANLQLTMPGETSPAKFLQKAKADTAWSLQQYTSLLPAAWQSYLPLQESYWAGLLGRTEIIAHGTTIDPAWYKNTPYYPLTPTQGCLCCTELWSRVDGKRMFSDQWQLAKTVARAGGANGYLLVIELDEQDKPVTLEEVVSLLGL